MKAIKEKRRREKAEREKLAISAPSKIKKSRSAPKKPKTVKDDVKTSHVIEYGIKHDEINKQRAEIKAILYILLCDI